MAAQGVRARGYDATSVIKYEFLQSRMGRTESLGSDLFTETGFLQ